MLLEHIFAYCLFHCIHWGLNSRLLHEKILVVILFSCDIICVGSREVIGDAIIGLLLLQSKVFVLYWSTVFFQRSVYFFLLFQVSEKSNCSGDFSLAEVVKGAKNRASLRCEIFSDYL